MSDKIKDLPINNYYNPTENELYILQTYFKSTLPNTIQYIRISIILSIFILVISMICSKFPILSKSQLYIIPFIFIPISIFVQIYFNNP